MASLTFKDVLCYSYLYVSKADRRRLTQRVSHWILTSRRGAIPIIFLSGTFSASGGIFQHWQYSASSSTWVKLQWGMAIFSSITCPLYWLSKLAAFSLQISLFLTVWWTKDSWVNCVHPRRWGAQQKNNRICWQFVLCHTPDWVHTKFKTNVEFWFTRTHLAWEENNINLAGKKRQPFRDGKQRWFCQAQRVTPE